MYVYNNLNISYFNTKHSFCFGTKSEFCSIEKRNLKLEKKIPDCNSIEKN